MDIARNTPMRAIPGTVPLFLLAVACVLGLLGFLYLEAIHWWRSEWTYSGTYYAHAVFIPFFVAAMIWRDRERLRRIPLGRSWWGLIPILLAFALVIHARRAEVTAVLSISFVLFLLGATMIVAGGAMTRALLFPIVFLLTMVPIVPNSQISPIAFPIQMTSAKLAATIMNLIGFPAVRTGTQISMENYTLNVEEPCSGFKTLVGLLAFAGAFAYLVDGALWKRLLLFFLAGPLAILINAVRIVLIGLVGELFSAEWALRFHDYSGFIVLIIGFMILFNMARWLRCEKFLGIPLLDPPANGQPGEPDPADAEVAKEHERKILDTRYGPPRTETLRPLIGGLVSVAALLALACVGKSFAKPNAIHYPLLKAEQIPSSLGDAWQQFGEDHPITPEVKSILEPEAYIDRNYTANPPNTGFVNLFVVGGSSRRTFHDPHDCFLGSGYILKDVGTVTIDTAVGPVTLLESHAENLRDKSSSVLMFLFVVDGKPYHTIASVHAAILRTTLLGSSGRPYYFVRFRQLANGTDEMRRQELKDFIRRAWPFMASTVLDMSAIKK